MRIESFWARGYRSLRDVRIEGLGPFNVFYGPNGAGKSNILEAIRALLQLVEVATLNLPEPGTGHASFAIEQLGIVQSRDLCAHAPSRLVVLGAHLTEVTDGSAPPSEISIELTLDWTLEQRPTLDLTQLVRDGRDLTQLASVKVPTFPTPAAQQSFLDERAKIRAQLSALFAPGTASRSFGLVRAERSLHFEKNQPPPDGEPDILAWHLRQGNLKKALLLAQIDPRHEVRRRLKAFRSLLAGEPLHRLPFSPVQDPRTGEADLRELLPEPNPEGRDISLDLAGLGIAQVYLILAQAMLLGTRMVGIEEPEAHLHAPTSGIALRKLLVRIVEEKHLDQLFIATHSNLFDLDPTGYFDVSLRKGSTVVERSDLTRIDHDHLYEPGPAKHALQRMLGYTPGDEIVFRRADGSGVTAREMLELLQVDDDLAVQFLQDIHGAAVRMVKVQQKAKKTGAG